MPFCYFLKFTIFLLFRALFLILDIISCHLGSLLFKIHNNFGQYRTVFSIFLAILYIVSKKPVRHKTTDPKFQRRCLFLSHFVLSEENVNVNVIYIYIFEVHMAFVSSFLLRFYYLNFKKKIDRRCSIFFSKINRYSIIRHKKSTVHLILIINS